MRAPAVAACVLYAITLGLDAAVVVLGLRTAGTPLAEGQPPLLAQLPFYVPIMLAYSTVGAVVAAKRPRNPIGWLFGLVALLFTLSLAFAGFALDVQVNGSAAERAIVQSTHLADPFDLIIAIFGFILLLYPTGRLPSPRWWAVALFMVLAATVGHVYAGPGHEVFNLAAPLALSAPFIRLRNASPIERRQLEWFVYFIALTAIAFVVSIVPSDPNIGGALWGLAAFFAGMTAVAAGVAILRYRLYDIDVLIRRTVIYGATSVGIAVTFFGVILLVEAILSPFTRGNELAVAASTLVSVAVFQPLRRRIQAAVEKRLYRSRYDATRVLEAFTARLRDEVDLDAVRADLVDAAERTVRPAHASVWIRSAR